MEDCYPSVETVQTQPYRKELIHLGPHEIDARLNGQYIGSWPTRPQALTELDRVAYEDARHDRSIDALLTTRLIPFGVPDGPRPEIACTTVALRAAFVAFCRHFDRNPSVLDRAERALQIDPATITMRPDGTIIVAGASGTHTVSEHACTCKDFFARETAHGGMCKHMIRRELIRLAQELLLSDQVTTIDLTTAYTTIGPANLNRLKLAVSRAQRAHAANSDTDVSLIVANRLLLLWLNGTAITRLTGLDGDGVSHIRLTPDHLAQAHAALSAALRRPTPPTIKVFLDNGDLVVLEETVIFTASARRAA